MYNSPIEMQLAELQTQILKQQEEDIYRAVVSYGVNVDKDELIRALQYDRAQYEKGYADATPKWISVKDRLPENDQTVLCFNYNGEYKVLRWNYVDWMWNSGIEWLTEEYVLYWMPLPQPPISNTLPEADK